MTKIEIFGLGCENCKRLEENVKKSIGELGITAEVIKIEDFEMVIRKGVKVTPGLAIDGELVSMGRVLDVEEITQMLKNHASLEKTSQIRILTNPSSSCGCGSSGTTLYPCAGGSNVGQITNEVAKRISVMGEGKFACLAGVGAGTKSFVDSAKVAKNVVAIDGCNAHCAKKTLERAGVTPTVHVVVTDLGVKKKYELECDPADVDTAVKAVRGQL